MPPIAVVKALRVSVHNVSFHSDSVEPRPRTVMGRDVHVYIRLP
jgi:hypothetical protein